MSRVTLARMKSDCESADPDDCSRRAGVASHRPSALLLCAERSHEAHDPSVVIDCGHHRGRFLLLLQGLQMACAALFGRRRGNEALDGDFSASDTHPTLAVNQGYPNSNCPCWSGSGRCDA